MRLASGILTFLLTAAAAVADSGDPPARVARLSFAGGQVSFRPAGVEQWSAASVNDPIVTGDRMWVDAGGRAELRVGSTALRLNSSTALGVLNLDDRTIQLSLTDGSLSVRLLNLPGGGTFEIDTPNMVVTVLRPGEYRVDANADTGVAFVTVRNGEAEVLAGGRTMGLRSWQSLRVVGTEGNVSGVLEAPDADDWDRWCQERDQREARSVSAQYVGREMTGYEDLDLYGTWRRDPVYGAVWMPASAGPDWAPYRYGHWRWIEPWGWTWVDDAPWGFAPFHYGRWARGGAGWFWVPGEPMPRPVYAPALVAFVGGAGGAGWFPLGPREVYRPAYHHSDLYVRSLNGPYFGGAATVSYMHRGAVTAVSHQTFATAQPVHRAMIAVPPHEMMRAPVVGMAAPVSPRMESFGPRAMQAPPSRNIDRQVLVRTAPPSDAVPFSVRRQALDANPGRPVDPGTLNNLRGRAPERSSQQYRTAGGPGGTDRQRTQESQPASGRTGGRTESGWRTQERQQNTDRPARLDTNRPQTQERQQNLDRPGRMDTPRPLTQERRQDVDRPRTQESQQNVQRPTRSESERPRLQERQQSQPRQAEQKSEPRQEQRSERKPEKKSEQKPPERQQ